jgi:hypothetical protein
MEVVTILDIKGVKRGGKQKCKNANFEWNVIGHFGVYSEQILKIVYKGGFFFVT